MILKITNVSNHSIGLIIGGKQHNLRVESSLVVDELTEQMNRLIDPYLKMLKLEVLYSGQRV